MRSTSALKRTGFPECIYILTERDKIIVHWLLCMIFFFYYPITDDHYIVSQFSGHLFFSEFRYGSLRSSVYKSCQLDR